MELLERLKIKEGKYSFSYFDNDYWFIIGHIPEEALAENLKLSRKETEMVYTIKRKEGNIYIYI